MAAASGNQKKRLREEKATSDDEEINWKTHVFTVGERLSFVALPECLWNEIEVIKIEKISGKQSQILVRYFGWHFEYHWHTYDEWLKLDDEMYNRFSKRGTGVHRVKCFVNLPGSLHHWPCFALVREPATYEAKAELKKYNHLYIEVTIVSILRDSSFFLLFFLLLVLLHTHSFGRLSLSSNDAFSSSISSSLLIHSLIRPLVHPFLQPFGSHDAFKHIFKRPTVLDIAQGVHVKYIENHEKQVIPYAEGIIALPSLLFLLLFSPSSTH